MQTMTDDEIRARQWLLKAQADAADRYAAELARIDSKYPARGFFEPPSEAERLERAAAADRRDAEQAANIQTFVTKGYTL